MLKVLLLSIMVLSMARCAKFDPCLATPMGGTDSSLPQTFTSAEGGFKIGLPATRANTETKEKSFRWDIINRGQFHVTYFESGTVLKTSEDREAMLNKLREVVRAKSEGQFEVDSEITLAGHPGREFRIRRKHSLEIERMYLVNDRIYIVTAFVPEEWNCGMDHVIKTLDSFELMDATTN